MGWGESEEEKRVFIVGKSAIICSMFQGTGAVENGTNWLGLVNFFYLKEVELSNCFLLFCYV